MDYFNSRKGSDLKGLVSRGCRHLDKRGREAIGKEIKSALPGNSYDYRAHENSKFSGSNRKKHLIERGLNPQRIKLIVSDGTERAARSHETVLTQCPTATMHHSQGERNDALSHLSTIVFLGRGHDGTLRWAASGRSNAALRYNKMLMRSIGLSLGLRLANASRLLSRSGKIWKRKQWKS